MATCIDCIHQYCCKYDRFFGIDDVENKCNYFKPTADVVEVVRCKDCEHYHTGKESTIYDDYCDILYYCNGSHRTVCQNDFCSYGIRKEVD